MKHDDNTDLDVQEIRGRLKPLTGLSPAPSVLARWKHYLIQMGDAEATSPSPRPGLGLTTHHLKWILAGNLTLVLLALFFLPVPGVSTRGHILSFELDPHSPAAYRSVAGLPWLKDTHYSVSHPASKDGLNRTHLHLVCLGRTEEEAGKWAEEILATPTVQKVKIFPVVVDESEPVYRHLLGRFTPFQQHQKSRLESTIASHLSNLSLGKAGKLSPIFSNELLADVFQSRGNSGSTSAARPLFPAAGGAQPVSFPER